MLTSWVIVRIKSSKKWECFQLSAKPIVIPHNRPMMARFPVAREHPHPALAFVRSQEGSGYEACVSHSQGSFSLPSVRLGWGAAYLQLVPYCYLPIGGARGRLQGDGGRWDLLPSLGWLFLSVSLHLGNST